MHMWIANDAETTYKMRIKTEKKILTTIELSDLEKLLIAFASYIDKRNMDMGEIAASDPKRVQKLAKEFTFRLACEK